MLCRFVPLVFGLGFSPSADRAKNFPAAGGGGVVFVGVVEEGVFVSFQSEAYSSLQCLDRGSLSLSL